MWIFNKPKEKAVQTEVSAVQLQQLLRTLAETPDVSFRFCRRDTWMKDFSFVNTTYDKSVLLYNDAEGKHLNVNINDITLFEIDRKVNGYQPFIHYKVHRSPELD